MPNYPSLNSDKLLPFMQICQELLIHPGYFDLAECPYPASIKDWLRQKFTPKLVEIEEEFEDLNSPAAMIDIGKKARILYQELEDLDVKDVGDTIQIIKTKVALLERLMTVADKSLGYRETAEFKKLVTDTLEDVLTADQRTAFMTRLETRNV